MGVTAMLTGHEVFRSLTVEEVDRLSRFSSLKHFEKDDIVYRHEQPATHAFVLIQGAVHLRLPARPAELSLLVAKVTKGQFFGLAPLMGSERYTVNAVCTEPSDVLAIEGKPFRDLLGENARIGFHIMTEVARAYATRYDEVLRHLHGILKQIPIVPY